jgi:muramoyltetrapeptide carboxypeptidase
VRKVKGRALGAGSKIGIVAPASPLDSMEEIAKAASKMAQHGYLPVLGATASPMDGKLAGTDIVRRADLESFWQDDSIAAIWCLRGGYGCIRILPQLWYGLFAKKPKILIGFSDITTLEMALWSQTGLVTFHGPVLASLNSEFSISQALGVLSGDWKNRQLEWPLEGPKKYLPIRSGITQGIVLGGNLTSIISLMGTRFLPSFEGVILFLEETGEQAYRVDRMLSQLLISGILHTVAAVLVGRCIPSSHQDEDELVKVFAERLGTLKCPVAYGYPIGHIAEQWTIPQGVMAEVDIDRGSLVLLEKPLD